MGLGCDAAPAPRSEWTCSSERTGAVDQGYGRLQTLLRQLRVGLPVRETQLFSSVQQEARGRHAVRRPRRAAGEGYGRLQTLLRQLRVGLPVRETQLFSSVQQEARGRHAVRRPRRAADHVKEQMKRWATAERLIELYRAGRRDA